MIHSPPPWCDLLVLLKSPLGMILSSLCAIEIIAQVKLTFSEVFKAVALHVSPCLFIILFTAMLTILCNRFSNYLHPTHLKSQVTRYV